MTDLTNQTIASVYGDYLTTTNGGQGLSTTLQQVQDGLGNASPMQIATNAVNFNRGANTFQLDGISLTSGADTINLICSETSISLFPQSTVIVQNMAISSSVKFGYSQVTFAMSPYNVTGSDNILGMTSTLVNGNNVSIVLLSPVSNTGRMITIKDESGSLTGLRTITVSSAAGTIDGAATKVLNTAYKSITFYSNGANWFIYSQS